MLNSWTTIIVICLFLIVLFFIVIYFYRKAKTTSGGLKRNSKIGIVKNLDYDFTFLPKKIVTIFEIHLVNGDVFFAGINRIESNLENGDEIEFWPTSESITRRRVVYEQIINRGVISRRDMEATYLKLEDLIIRSKQPDTTIYNKENNPKIIPIS